MKRNISKWRMLPLGLMMVLMGILGMKGAHAQCLDSVPWGTPLSFENNCCWTVAPGSDWFQHGNANQIVSDGNSSADHRILSPWVQIPASAQQDSLMLTYITGSVCHEDYSVCVTTDGVHFDTLFRGRTPDEDLYYDDPLYIGAYAGQWVRFELCHYVLNRTHESDTACLDDYLTGEMLFRAIKLKSSVLPVATISLPTKAYVGENTLFSASLYSGSHTGLTYTWHSSLMGQTLTGDSVTMIYTAAGMDTVTMVASNAYGSDTLVSTIQVFDCSEVIVANPWMVNFETDYDCWRTVGDYGWSKYYDYNNIGIMPSSGGHSMIASPAVALPADSTGLRLYWKDRRQSNTATYYVMVSRSGRFDLDDYDTIFSGTPSASILTQRSVSLADYAGDTVYIAFRQKYQSGRSAYVTDVKMYNALVPLGTLEAPTYAVATGDTVRYTLHLTQGDSVSYSWHSALLDTSITTIGSMVSIVYPFPGSETLTATASNAHGTLTLEKSLGVYGCDTISVFPWSEGFVETGSVASYNACWEIVGYYHVPDNYGYGYDEEDGSSSGILWNDLMRSSTRWDYMLTPPIAVPAVLEKNLSLWVEHCYSLMAIVETEEGNADTVYSLDSRKMTMRRRPISLVPYAGQTIRVRLLNNNSYASYAMSLVDRIRVDYDTVPVVVLSAQEKTTTDSATLFVATQLRGFVPGLTYTWHSQVGGTFTTNATGDSAWVTYSAGITGLYDTVSVTVTNSYCSYTTRRAIRIINCLPATELPWIENFNEGITCWYKPEGSNWAASTYYGHDPKCMTSGRVNDSVPHWIMSKAVDIPADTALAVRLFWDVSSSNANHQLNYSVWVTTSEDYTDTANYTLLYLDTAYHSQYFAFDRLSTSLAAYAGQTIHVAFRNAKYLGNSTTLYIDNVTVRTTALPVVSLEASSMVDSHEPVTYSATLTEGSTDGLTCLLHSSLMDTTITDTSHLSPFTFHLSYTSGGTDTLTLIATNIYGSDTAVAVVTVQNCAPRVLPYYENFEGIVATAAETAGNLPDCWNYFWNGSNAAYAPHVITTGGYQYMNDIPDNALLFVAGNHTGYGSDAMVFLPRFADSLQHLALALDYRFENSSRGNLTVGWYDSNEMFHIVKILTPHASDYVRDTVLFTDHIAANYRIALWWNYGSSWFAAVVDNIEVFVDNTIHAPANLAVDNIGAHSARVTWAAVDSASAYHVQINGVLDTTVSGLACNLTGLSPHTQYTVHVAAIVGTETGRSASTTFTTLCEAVSLPYSMDFENESHLDSICWRTIRHPYCSYPSASINGNSSPNLFIVAVSSGYNTENYDTSYRNFACSPLIDPQGQGVDISFRASLWSFGATSFFEVGIMADVADTAGFIPLGNVTPSSSSSTYINHQFSVAAATLPQPFCLAFRFGGTLIRCYIDDISITASIPVTHELTLSVNDTAMGTVSGAGTYEEGSNITFSATPNEGYHFVMWNDSVTIATRTVRLETDTAFTAFFAPDSTPVIPDTVWYTVTVNRVCRDCNEAIPDDYVTGEGRYIEGSTVTLTGYVGLDEISFEFWIDEAGDTIFNNPYSFVINTDRTLTAVFGSNVGIDNVSTYQRINVYPNPASMTVTVETDQPSILTLFDATGRKCGQWKVENGKTTLDISTLPTGVYFVRLSTSPTIRKLIIR